MRNELPELCFSTLPDTGQLITLKRNERGYYPSDWNTEDKTRNLEIAQFQNYKLGITPVNIMGVVAFPNENSKREIRFIDSEYNKLFTVPDGGNVILTHFDGKSVILPCRYIDDYHAQIGVSVYHICQFAEAQERSGSVYAPEVPKANDVFDTYEIYQIKDVSGVDYCFRSYGEAAKTLNPGDYQRVYAGMYAKDASLEQLWVKHNRDTRPFGNKMRSMSVSDIVVLTRDGKKKSYYVDSFGFQEVDNFLKAEQQKNKKRSEPER